MLAEIRPLQKANAEFYSKLKMDEFMDDAKGGNEGMAGQRSQKISLKSFAAIVLISIIINAIVILGYDHIAANYTINALKYYHSSLISGSQILSPPGYLAYTQATILIVIYGFAALIGGFLAFRKVKRLAPKVTKSSYIFIAGITAAFSILGIAVAYFYLKGKGMLDFETGSLIMILFAAAVIIAISYLGVPYLLHSSLASSASSSNAGASTTINNTFGPPETWGIGIASNYAYVTDGWGSIAVINTKTNTILKTLSTGGPEQVAVSSDGTNVYVLGTTGLTTINTATNQVANSLQISNGSSILWDVALSPNGNYAYVTAQNDTVQIVNLGTDKVISEVSGITGAQSVAVSPDGSRIYVSGTSSGALVTYIINATTDSVSGKIPGVSPSSMAFAPNGKYLYMTNSNGGSISIVNTTTNLVIDNISTGYFPSDIQVSPDGSYVYVTNYEGDSISVINTTTMSVAKTIDYVSNYTGPWALTLLPNSGNLYVTNRAANGVAEINITTGQVVGSITNVFSS